MKQFNNVTMKSGFTLMEAIVAIFVITTGIVGVLSLVTQTISSATISKDKLIAAYLAQEGIEIVRNIRDTNWLEAETYVNSWDEGLTGNCLGDVDNCETSSGCIVDYNHSYGPSMEDPNLPVYTGQYLNIDAAGFYSYSGGTQSKFQRKIVTESGGTDILRICTLVQWQEKGKPYSVPAQENLYNWK